MYKKWLLTLNGRALSSLLSPFCSPYLAYGREKQGKEGEGRSKALVRDFVSDRGFMKSNKKKKKIYQYLLSRTFTHTNTINTTGANTFERLKGISVGDFQKAFRAKFAKQQLFPFSPEGLAIEGPFGERAKLGNLAKLKDFFPYRKSFLCYWLLPFMGFVFLVNKETHEALPLRKSSPLSVFDSKTFYSSPLSSLKVFESRSPNRNESLPSAKQEKVGERAKFAPVKEEIKQQNFRKHCTLYLQSLEKYVTAYTYTQASQEKENAQWTSTDTSVFRGATNLSMNRLFLSPSRVSLPFDGPRWSSIVGPNDRGLDSAIEGSKQERIRKENIELQNGKKKALFLPYELTEASSKGTNLRGNLAKLRNESSPRWSDPTIEDLCLKTPVFSFLKASSLFENVVKNHICWQPVPRWQGPGIEDPLWGKQEKSNLMNFRFFLTGKHLSLPTGGRDVAGYPKNRRFWDAGPVKEALVKQGNTWERNRKFDYASLKTPIYSFFNKKSENKLNVAFTLINSQSSLMHESKLFLTPKGLGGEKEEMIEKVSKEKLYKLLFDSLHKTFKIKVQGNFSSDFVPSKASLPLPLSGSGREEKKIHSLKAKAFRNVALPKNIKMVYPILLAQAQAPNPKGVRSPVRLVTGDPLLSPASNPLPLSGLGVKGLGKAIEDQTKISSKGTFVCPPASPVGEGKEPPLPSAKEAKTKSQFHYYSNFLKKYLSKIKDLLLINKTFNNMAFCLREPPFPTGEQGGKSWTRQKPLAKAQRRLNTNYPIGSKRSSLGYENIQLYPVGEQQKMEKLLRSFFSIKKKKNVSRNLNFNVLQNQSPFSLKKRKLNFYKKANASNRSVPLWEKGKVGERIKIAVSKQFLNKKGAEYTPRLLIQNRSFILFGSSSSFRTNSVRFGLRLTPASNPLRLSGLGVKGFDENRNEEYLTKNELEGLKSPYGSPASPSLWEGEGKEGVRSIFLNTPIEGQEHYVQEETKIEKQRKYIQKKRRRKKLKKETRRRKKRKRFYPRPTWLRHRLLLKFLKKRFISKSSLLTPLGVTRIPHLEGKLGKREKQLLYTFSFARLVPNLERGNRSEAGESRVNSLLKKPVFNNSNSNSNSNSRKNLLSLYITSKENFTISRPVLQDLKRLLWKSYWLRSNLNPYLNKVKTFLTEIKESTQKWEFFTNLKQFLQFLGGFWHVAPVPLQLHSFMGNVKENAAFPQRGPESTIFSSMREETPSQRLFPYAKQEALNKWESTLYFAEYNRITYSRIQEFLAQIRENFATLYNSSFSSMAEPDHRGPNSRMEDAKVREQTAKQFSPKKYGVTDFSGNKAKIRASHISHSKMQDNKRIAALREHDILSKSRTADFWVNLGKALTADNQIAYSYSNRGQQTYFKNSKEWWLFAGKDYINEPTTPQLRMLWALSKTSPSLYLEGSCYTTTDSLTSRDANSKYKTNLSSFLYKRKQTWVAAPESSKIREQTKYNKTKKMYRNITTKLQTLLNEQYELSNSIMNPNYISKGTSVSGNSLSTLPEVMPSGNSSLSSPSLLYSPSTESRPRSPFPTGERLASEGPRWSGPTIEGLPFFKNAFKKIRQKEEKLQFLNTIPSLPFTPPGSGRDTRKNGSQWPSLAERSPSGLGVPKPLWGPSAIRYPQSKDAKAWENILLLHEYKKQIQTSFRSLTGNENELSSSLNWLNNLTSKSSYWFSFSSSGYGATSFPTGEKQYGANLAFQPISQQKATLLPYHQLLFPSIFPNIEDSYLQFINKNNSYLQNVAFAGKTGALTPQVKQTQLVGTSPQIIWISSLLFHFCSILSLLSISQIRGLLKFYLLGMSKLYKSFYAPGRLIYSLNSLLRSKTTSLAKLGHSSSLGNRLLINPLGSPTGKVGERSALDRLSEPQRGKKGNAWRSKAIEGRFLIAVKAYITGHYMKTKSPNFPTGPSMVERSPSGKYGTLGLLQTRMGNGERGDHIKNRNNKEIIARLLHEIVTTYVVKPHLFLKKPILLFLLGPRWPSIVGRSPASPVGKEKEGDGETKSKSLSLIFNKNSAFINAYTKLYLLFLLNFVFSKGYGSYARIQILLKQTFDVLGRVGPKSFFNFLEKPGELIIDWIAYIFLVEWASDMTNTIPENVDFYIGNSYDKTTRILYSLNLYDLYDFYISSSIFKFTNSNFLLKEAAKTTKDLNLNLNNSLQFSLLPMTIEGSRTPLASKGSSMAGQKAIEGLDWENWQAKVKEKTNTYETENWNFSILNIGSTFIKNRVFHLYEILLFQFFQPDTDLMVRQKKGVLFWDIWGDFLMQVAEDSNINISELTSLKEEQIKLFEKSAEFAQFDTPRWQVPASEGLNLFSNLSFSLNLNPSEGKAKHSESILAFARSFHKFAMKASLSHESEAFMDFCLHKKENSPSPNPYLTPASPVGKGKEGVGENKGKSFMKPSLKTSFVCAKLKNEALIQESQLPETLWKQRASIANPRKEELGKGDREATGEKVSPTSRTSRNAKEVLNKKQKLKKIVSGIKEPNNNFAAQQFLSYQGKDTELFIDLHPPKSFSMISLLKNNESVQTSIGPLVCQIFSGIISKQISKNVLVVGSPSSSFLSSTPSFGNFGKIDYDSKEEPANGILRPSMAGSGHRGPAFSQSQNQRGKKARIIDLPLGLSQSQDSGYEKTLLIQAIAGETELKIITDNAYRYAMVFRGVAVGIKLLRDVFDSLSLHTPCLFLIEDIHAIGERRPLLISDDEKGASPNGKTTFGGPSQQEEIHEKNQVLYQLSKHVITHYRKPYKGDFSLLIPTNHFCFDLFRNDLNSNASVSRGTGSTDKIDPSSFSFTSSKIPINSGTGQASNDSSVAESFLGEQSREQEERASSREEKGSLDNLFTSLSSVSGKIKRGQLSTRGSAKLTRLLIKSSQLFAPPATSPFSILNLKEEKKFKPYQIVSEMPWGGLPGEQLAQISKASYSIRVKVAMLADMAISTLSVKLDMITDLLVIIDSVKANRGFVVFATTHVPYILDPALRRPGRLDETITLGIFPNLLSRWDILKSSFGFFTAGKEQTGFKKGISLDFTYSIDASSLKHLNSTPINNNHLFSLAAPLQANSMNFPFRSSVSNPLPFSFRSPLGKSGAFPQRGTERLGKGAASPFPKGEQARFPSNVLENIHNYKKRYLHKILSQTYFIASNMLYDAIETSISSSSSSMVGSLSKVGSLPTGTKGMIHRSSEGYSNNKPHFLDYLQPLNMETSSLYMNLYASPLQFKNYIVKLMSGKIGEILLFSSSPSLPYGREGTSKANTFKNKNLDSSWNPLMNPRKANGTSLARKSFQSIQWSEAIPTSFGLSNTWSLLSSLILSFIQKRSLCRRELLPASSYHALISPQSNGMGISEGERNAKLAQSSSSFIVSSTNLIVPKFLYFNNQNSLYEPPSPPSSNILLPARRYENYRRSFAYFSGRKISTGILEKIKTHQQQRLVKKLYGFPVKNSFRSEIIENRFTSFTNANLMIGSFSSILQKPSHSNWFFKNQILMRHKNYLTNQWWNGHLPEHNAETTFLSDIDWRYSFVESIGDLLLDFPDADQHYNPRNRRWLLTKGEYHNWFNFERTFYSEIYTHFIFDSFIQAFHIYEKNREILDFYAFYILRKGLKNVGNEFEIIKLYKRFLSNT